MANPKKEEMSTTLKYKRLCITDDCDYDHKKERDKNIEIIVRKFLSENNVTDVLFINEVGGGFYLEIMYRTSP